MPFWSASAYFVAGFMLCAILSGAILLVAVRTYVEEDQDEEE